MENETHVILISGRYVTHKFDTSSSCLTYKFKQDNLGFKSIEQQRQLPLVGTVGLDHEYMWVSQDWRWDRSGSQSQPFETGNDTIEIVLHKIINLLKPRCGCNLNICSYTGNLYAPSESTPAKMIVRFPLSESHQHCNQKISQWGQMRTTHYMIWSNKFDYKALLQ